MHSTQTAVKRGETGNPDTMESEGGALSGKSADSGDTQLSGAPVMDQLAPTHVEMQLRLPVDVARWQAAVARDAGVDVSEVNAVLLAVYMRVQPSLDEDAIEPETDTQRKLDALRDLIEEAFTDLARDRFDRDAWQTRLLAAVEGEPDPGPDPG